MPSTSGPGPGEFGSPAVTGSFGLVVGPRKPSCPGSAGAPVEMGPAGEGGAAAGGGVGAAAPGGGARAIGAPGWPPGGIGDGSVAPGGVLAVGSGTARCWRSAAAASP